ncbi:hypothetical protein [Candidatus Frankia nodulisporulans]|uniref:hypothetical protein n=1 Tax=Candidatus Frankia nodulisporulans TaxID=2060052 RepID=UPI0013D83518|nr:hypothetical protein [Candidatus Frankia nodulisporulans]
MVPWGPGEWALSVRPGSTAGDLYRALGEMPAGVEFLAAFGDVDTVLVYRLPGEVPSRRELVTLRGSALDVPDAEPNRSRWMTTGERQAFRAGYCEALDTVRLYVSRLAEGVPADDGEPSPDPVPPADG